MFSYAFLPTPSLALDFFRRKRYARIQQREEQGSIRQWFVLCGPAPSEARLKPQPSGLRQILPPEDRVWADPFIWRQGEDFYIFCEEWLYREPHGHISVMQVSNQGEVLSPAKPVLKEPYHLSYPFLFEYEGALHLLPEGGASRMLEVYQCEEFPGRWRKRTTLMRNIRFTDAALFPHHDRWWLFLTMRRGLYALNRDLFLFWADTPLAQNWTPHPSNPVIRDIQSARPAGRVFEVGGKLYRPSQNCLIRYGHSLRINEIIRLDTKGYEERLIGEVRPDEASGLRAHHHIDWREGLLVMDSQRLIPRREQHVEKKESA
jgi:hypothetical protein